MTMLYVVISRVFESGAMQSPAYIAGFWIRSNKAHSRCFVFPPLTGDTRDHARVADCGETQTAVFLRDNHAEEALFFDEVPNIRRQVALLLHIPVVDSPTQFLDRPIEECLFLRT